MCNNNSYIENIINTNQDLSFSTSDPNNIYNSHRVEIRKKSLGDNIRDKIHILRFDFDWKTNLEHLTQQCVNHDAVVVSINLPYGLWYARIKQTEELVDEGYKEVKRLIDQGVPSRNIVLDGLCITSAIATLVTEKLLKEGIIVNLFSDRSFSTIDSLTTNNQAEINAKSLDNTNHHANPLNFIIDKAIVFLNYNIDVSESLKTLYMQNPDRINYIVYKSKKDKNGKRDLDYTIPTSNSVHKALKSFRIKAKSPIKEAIFLIQTYKFVFVVGKNIVNTCDLKETLLSNKNDPTLDYAKYINKLIEGLEERKKEYAKVTQEAFIKELTIESFNDAISEIKENMDFDRAIDYMKHILYIINSYHKVEKLYDDADFKMIKLNKRFEELYPRWFPDDSDESVKKEMQNKLYNDKDFMNTFMKDTVVRKGHVIGRHFLYSRLFHSTVEPNLLIQNDRVKKWICNAYPDEKVSGTDSLFGQFISNIRKLNEEELIYSKKDMQFFTK